MYCKLLKVCYDINSVYCKCNKMDCINSDETFKIL